MSNNILNGFGIANFKCFKEEIIISQRPITINIGPNNSGKSSLFKSFSLLQGKKKISGNAQFRNKLKMVDDLDSFNIKNFGMPEEFLNDNTKPLVFTIPTNSVFQRDWLKGKSISTKLFYNFANNSNESEANNKNTSSKESIPQLGKLNRYQIYIDNNLYFEIFKTPSTASKKKDTNSENIGVFNLTKFQLASGVSNKEVNFQFTFPANTFGAIDILLKSIETELNIYNIPNKDLIIEIIDIVDQSLNSLRFEFSLMKFVDLNRREFGRYFDINNSTIFHDFHSYYFSRNEKKMANFDLKLKKLLHLFGIPEDFEIITNKNLGFQFLVKEKNGQIRNIADYGSGINQILPLILSSISYIYNVQYYDDETKSYVDDIMPISVIVEEPESNFHPDFQSKLADLFMLLYKEWSLNFFIETHSEYMVRRFQNLIAQGKLKNSDVIINYFWVENGINKCKPIQFREDGGLTDVFENGFYDESLLLENSLLQFSNLN